MDTINIYINNKFLRFRLFWKDINQPQSYGSLNKLYSNKCLLYAKEPTLQHGFNAANYNLIQVHGAEISSKTCHLIGWAIFPFLALQTQINLLLAALKLCCKAGSFPYNKHVFEDKKYGSNKISRAISIWAKQILNPQKVSCQNHILSFHQTLSYKDSCSIPVFTCNHYF